MKETKSMCRCVDRPTSKFVKGDIYLYEKFTEYVRLCRVDGTFLSNVFDYGFDRYFIDLGQERDDRLGEILNSMDEKI